MPRRCRAHFLEIAGVLLATLAATWLGIGLAHEWAHPAVGWLPLPLSTALAVIACARAARDSRLDAGTRRFWRHLTLASVFFTAGTLGNAYDAVGGSEPSQMIGPVTLALYLAVLGLVIWALLRLPSWQRSRADWIRFALDACMVLVTTGALVWHLALRDHERWTAQTGSSGPMLAIMLAAFVGVSTFVKVGFAGAGRLDRQAIRILAAGAAIASSLGGLSPFLADRIYLSSSLIAVPVAALTINLAAARQWFNGDRAPEARRRSRRISVLPYAAVAVTDVLLLSTGTGDATETTAMQLAAVALTALVVVRQILALRDNQRLLDELRGYQAKLTHQAMHDSLTGLANRALMEQHVGRLLDEGRPFHVALLDLDDFKTVNDRLGHHVGDLLIMATGSRLTGVVDDRGLVARLGGDEFIVVVPDGSEIEALLRRLITVVGAPVELEGHTVVTAASVGVTTTRPGDVPAELLRRADVAMYAAKHAGGDAWHWFDAAMDRAADDEARLAAELRRAPAEGQLVALYQPIVSLPDGAPAGAEVLLRWQHPERGLLTPDTFIPLAENNGFIVELGDWVLREAVRQSVEWRDRLGGRAPERISVNVSARQLTDPHFVDRVAGVLLESGLAPHRLMLEVTETAVLSAGVAVAQLHRLKALGVRLALDDFATGHSSLSLLLDCPVDVLKVDKSFVSGTTAGRAGAIIVRNLIGFTTDFGIEAVAEGVETTDQAARLHEAGYRFAQGYLFGRPMSASALEELITVRAIAVA
ncbi:putative bifunctional diguanylate cyclase/phosphodiesterase [Paractinoplanes hotanensis]|uniref:Bifunctional diguanylate cyclase/phosphodiesterase n=1 Tax=Paractinoplanes hotanensis TaxID=2906497 RepID=A0ABT0XQN7_9ACTN|nr:bifunctional diguanylate cyclase/phosphodiesterase [Actinoplanes hotanensis]MCM4076086.1 bifunctional diguanylate cyclase/phosphodiesterase [Actinoplanes hotanensis]